MRIITLFITIICAAFAEEDLRMSARAAAAATSSIASGRDMRDVLGVTHVSGKYHLSRKDFLTEGADTLLTLETRVIKIWFNSNPKKGYSYNAVWPEGMKTLTDLARSPYYASVFERPFKHYLLETFTFAGTVWNDGMTESEIKAEYTEIYELTKFLLTRYRGTGKTFVLQNWEGDNAIGLKKKSPAEREAAIAGMTAWLNCRQDAVSKAREEAGTNGVLVVCCAEVNWVPSSKEKFDAPLVVDTVVPSTHCDLYSISSWGTKTAGTEADLAYKLDYIAAKAPASAIYGEKNVMVGEFGAPENIYVKPETTYPELAGDTAQSQLMITKKQLDASLRWGAVYIVYWELYCNEFRDAAYKLPEGENAPADALKGFWLIRPDGSLTPTWDYFKAILSR